MKLIKEIIVVIILFLLSIGLIFIDTGHKMYKDATKEVSLDEKISEIQASENYTSLLELPQTYLNAIISVEDHRFYEHNGVDIIAIGRAFVNDIKTLSFEEGGSTITQQFAKNVFFTQEKKISRKIAEVFMAFDIEKNYEKNEILELYINTIYFGNGYYNIKEATLGYFGKLPREMTDNECIMLAGIPNAPTVYNLNKNPELARKRQKQVINKMIKYEYLTKKEAFKILNEE